MVMVAPILPKNSQNFLALGFVASGRTWAWEDLGGLGRTWDLGPGTWGPGDLGPGIRGLGSGAWDLAWPGIWKQDVVMMVMIF